MGNKKGKGFCFDFLLRVSVQWRGFILPRMTTPQYPEHEKFKKYSQDQLVALRDFSEYLWENRFSVIEERYDDAGHKITKYYTPEQSLHLLLGIKEWKLEEERQQMIDNLRKQERTKE